jgi:hypothetical protein
MKYIITENKLSGILRKFLEMEFQGYGNMYYTWADFNCRMGVCCDQYAVGFTLPADEYDNYLFKLVDGEHYDDDGDYPEELQGDLPEPCYEQPDIQDPKFDTIVVGEDMAERLETMFSDPSLWKKDLMKLINQRYGTHAKDIIVSGYWI